MIGNVRKVVPEQIGVPVRRFMSRRFRLRGSSLGRSARAMHDALNQVNSGIPLNWTQVEDDPALQVLAYLSENQELAHYRGISPSQEMHAALYDSLAAKLPAPKAQPKKEEPVRPLAGFSEAVPVLTQAEEDLPSVGISFVPWIRAAVVAVVVIGLALFAFNRFAGNAGPTPRFTWIDLRQNGQPVSKSNRPASTALPACTSFKIDDPDAKRSFNRTMAYRDMAQQNVGFPLNFLPATLPISPTYTFRFLDASVSPCAEDAPGPADQGAMVKLDYAARQTLPHGAYTSGNMTIYQGQAVPLYIDVPTNNWKEVNIGPAHGIYWQGGPFVDLGGNNWIGQVSVLALETGDSVTMFVGPSDSGTTEEMLTALVKRAMQGDDTSADQNQVTQRFHWIEIRQNGQAISPNALGKDWAPPVCPGGGKPNYNVDRTFQIVNSQAQARSYTGYQLFTIPTNGFNPFTYTTHVVEGAVRPCSGDQFVTADPGAAVKLRYSIQHAADGTSHQGEIDTFQSQDLPATIDVSSGIWKTERVGDWQGVFWSGGNYHDPEGNDWQHDVSVLVAERDRTVITLLGRVDEGATEDLLLTLLGQLLPPQ